MLNIVFLQAQAQGGQDWSFLLMMGGMFVVMYFFMIRPQQKKRKEAEKFRDTLKKGTDVVTAGGIHGKVSEVTGDVVILDIDRGTKLTIEKASISHEKGQTPVKK